VSDVNDPGNSAVKPGYKTTEFWLSLLATLLGAVFASGFFDPANPEHVTVLRVLGFASMILGTLGYTVPRPLVKGRANTVAGDLAKAGGKYDDVPGLTRSK